MITIERLTVEHYESGLYIDTPRPRLSWRFNSDPEDEQDRDWEQAAYELEIVDQGHLHAEASVKVDDANCTQTYHVASSQSVLVPWPASASTLDPRSRRRVRVRAQSTSGVWTPWSEPLLLETGLLKREDWVVPFITGPPQPKGENKRPFYFRARFLSPSAASRARLYITARGVYEAHLNGQPVSDHVLAPGWQSYSHRLAYQTFDVTQFLDLNVGAENTIGVILGEGWYSGRLGYRGGIHDIWGDRMAVLVQLELDGKSAKFEEDWTWSYGPILSSGIYDGEIYDGSLVDPHWSTSSPSPAESKALGTGLWLPVEMLPLDGPLPSTPQSPPIRRTEEIKPIEIIITPSGQTVLDMGQNMVGWLRWNTSGPAIDLNPGSTHEVTLQHAEVLELGELGTRPLRHAAATETVRLSAGVSMQGYEPKFTFHGFRYVQVTGWPGLTLDDLTGIVVHTDMERLGEFSCSHSWLNRLHDNVVWGMRGNFLSVPTDCPQRDERLGWTGDIQVFTPTAAFLYDTSGILGDWLRDVRSEQLFDLDNVPSVVTPNILDRLRPEDQGSFAIWGDVVVLTPYDLYQASADDEILRRQWDSLQAWLDQGIVRDPKTDLWHPDVLQLGDWLDPMAPPDCAAWGQTNSVMVADAYLVHVTRIAGRIASVLKLKQETERYGKQAERLLTEFGNQWISPNGMLSSESQCALALALHLRLEGPGQQGIERRSAWSARLDRRIRSQGFKISTGFAGTPIILSCLADAGLTHLAYRMLQEKQLPSWLYPISMGATTCWERWDSMLPDGRINPGEMTSFNHFALGSVAHFLHSQMGGLVIEEPGWKVFRVRPRPGGTVTQCAVSHITPYGRAACAWEIVGDRLVVEVEVPPNSRAIIDLPSQETSEVGSGKRRFEVDYQPDPRWPPKVHQLNYSAVLLDKFVE